MHHSNRNPICVDDPGPRQIQSGVWKGSMIRRARKAGRCQYWLGEPGRCPERINVGDQYFDGEMDSFKAGGFARERYCMRHAPSGQPSLGEGKSL